MVERIKDYVCKNGFCDCYVSISPGNIEKNLSGFRKFSFFFSMIFQSLIKQQI